MKEVALVAEGYPLYHFSRTKYVPESRHAGILQSPTERTIELNCHVQLLFDKMYSEKI